ncbi:hypothetical protein LAZ67_6003656 [Cordylochernes scorpioides]|uniref:GIY-YIG domain-containing protein n=1 Tax=Cordylochernes scorpioides TaxID=51811 RepID=A0ABY6KKS4_9ARAC|nr:hypothetical protein LAZ67_6003656 [Cordylochernes scorpioides]
MKKANLITNEQYAQFTSSLGHDAYIATCLLPFSPDSIAISRILRPYGIRVFYNSPPSIATLLRNPITKADIPNNPIHSTGAVYAVSCQDCTASYVGETGRTAYIRMTEHKRNINNRDPKSLIYQHILHTGHKFNLDHPKILYQHIRNKQIRLFLESIISTQTNSINRKIDLPEAYHGYGGVLSMMVEGVLPWHGGRSWVDLVLEEVCGSSISVVGEYFFGITVQRLAKKGLRARRGVVTVELAGEALLTVLEGKLQGKRSRGRRRQGYTDDLKQWTGRYTYEEMKRMAEEVWRDHEAHPK